VKYTNATPRVSLDGIRAATSQVKFIPLREAPKDLHLLIWKEKPSAPE
jgi:hypothetical protein